MTKIANPIRKPILAATLMLTAACGGAAHAADVTMFRSPSCGCCLEWLKHMRDYWAAAGQTGEVKSINSQDMQGIKLRVGVPLDLASCHTTFVDGYVIEGHVPAADVARLLKERPEGVRGLAVAGMPIGSPGMEHGDHREAYQVIAFGKDGLRVWSSYPASGG